MHATARTHQPAEASSAPARPRLRTVPPPAPRRRALRLPSAASVALYALGLTAGFLLAAMASAPGGAGVVAGEMARAAAGVGVGGVARLRARAVARRRARPRGRAASL